MRLIVKVSLIAVLAAGPWFALPFYGAIGSEREEEASEPVLSAAQRLAKGKKLAKDKCASCHSIKRTGNSTNKAAPPFRTFASKWPLESLEESLAEGIVTGHEEMPEVVFTPGEIIAFLDFLHTLQEK